MLIEWGAACVFNHICDFMSAMTLQLWVYTFYIYNVFEPSISHVIPVLSDCVVLSVCVCAQVINLEFM